MRLKTVQIEAVRRYGIPVGCQQAPVGGRWAAGCIRRQVPVTNHDPRTDVSPFNLIWLVYKQIARDTHSQHSHNTITVLSHFLLPY